MTQRRRISASLVTCGWLLLFLTVVSTLFSSSNVTVLGKEVQATREWTLLGANDTIAAGMHVRMDMTTGEKWVKLPDEDDDDGDVKSRNPNDSSSSGLALQVTENDETTTTTTTKKASTTDKAPQQPSLEDAQEDTYDYDVMYRTLSHLPRDEQERMGGIPELPSSSSSSSSSSTTRIISPQERKVFEARLKDVWERRQAELKAVQEDFLADLPQLLKDRIQSMREYLSDPIQHLRDLATADAAAAAADKDDADTAHGRGLTHIVSILADLEFQLNDLDMARDFYTLGGWPLLVSLVAYDVHHGPTNQTNAPLDQQVNNNIQDDENNVFAQGMLRVQAHAAWALGTAVKNAGEFHPWIVENLVVGDRTTTALDVVLRTLVTSATDNQSGIVAGVVLPMQRAQQQLQQKALYAMGSFLRGNPTAQVYFARGPGPNLLGDLLVHWADQPTDKHALKMTQRLLSLADDVVAEIQLHPERRVTEEDERIAQMIVASMTTAPWCRTTRRVLQPTLPRRLQEVALKAVGVLGPHCEANCQAEADPTSSSSYTAFVWDAEQVVDDILACQASWKTIDPMDVQEMDALVDAALDALTVKK